MKTMSESCCQCIHCRKSRLRDDIVYCESLKIFVTPEQAIECQSYENGLCDYLCEFN